MASANLFIYGPVLFGKHFRHLGRNRLAVIYPAFEGEPVRSRPPWNPLASASSSGRPVTALTGLRLEKRRSDLVCHVNDVTHASNDGQITLLNRYSIDNDSAGAVL